ncbi:MAG: DUF3006 domain-containing protein [Clostridia bacterium]|nr:DUF3006 domain-containing protein [Clostridia bacterium]
MEKLCVDRIIGDIVVCEKEDMSRVEIKISDIPFEVYEGSVISTDGKTYFPEESEEEERRRKVIELQNKLRNKK